MVDVLSGFFECALGIVLGTQGLTIFIHGTIALIADIEDLADVDVRPHFSPLRLEISRENRAELVCRSRALNASRIYQPLESGIFTGSCR